MSKIDVAIFLKVLIKKKKNVATTLTQKIFKRKPKIAETCL